MDPFLRVIRNSQLFSGITEEELREMLGCLDVRRKRFQKGDFIFRTGDVTESLGLLLSGRALVLQDDFWGNRNLFSTVTQGHTFAETFACAAGTAMTVSVLADSDCEVLFLNVKRILTVCPTACSHHSRVIRNLLADMAGKNLACNEKLLHMAQRTTRANFLLPQHLGNGLPLTHGAAHDAGQAVILFFRHGPETEQRPVRHPVFPAGAGRLSLGGTQRPLGGAF